MAEHPFRTGKVRPSINRNIQLNEVGALANKYSTNCVGAEWVTFAEFFLRRKFRVHAQEAKATRSIYLTVRKPKKPIFVARFSDHYQNTPGRYHCSVHEGDYGVTLNQALFLAKSHFMNHGCVFDGGNHE